MEIVFQNQTSITVKATSSFVSGEGFINLVLSNQTIAKEVWVGRPNKPTNILLYPNLPCVNQLIIAVANSDYPFIENIEFAWTGVSNYSSQNQSNSEIHFTTNYPNPYTETIRVTSSNACGESFQFSKTFLVADCNGNGGNPAPHPVSIEFDEEVIVFPNPAMENVFINLKLLTDSQKEFNFQIKLFDVNGSMIFETQTNQILEQINTSNFKSGIYILHLSNGEKTIFKKLVINH